MRRRIDEVARFTSRPREVAEFYAGILDQPLPKEGSEVFNFTRTPTRRRTDVYRGWLSSGNF